jgi:glycosyltransferase involved in cell wall biosynthesis
MPADLFVLAVREWHLITSEYPPQPGGVSDYTRSLAKGFANEGDRVHVWCPPASGAVNDAGVTVHRDLGRVSSQDLRKLSRELDQFPGPRQILVQWVPHGYGLRSMNVGFCLWLWERSRGGDRVDVMVHEASLGFGEGSWRQNIPALVHRLMTAILIRAATRIWISIPRWESRFRPYAFGRDVPFEWLPIPSNIPVVEDPAGIRALRKRYAPDGQPLIGHFGTYGPLVGPALEAILLAQEHTSSAASMLLMGAGSDEYQRALDRKRPELTGRIHATGALASEDVSRHLSACDLLVQPFLDGVSSRRTSFMAGLSHGKPIVTNTGPATEPLWAGSGAVALVPNLEPGGFVAAMEQLFADENQRTRMADTARKLYQERFDLSHVIARLRQVGDRETTCAF